MLTLDDAIQHCLEVAEEKCRFKDYYDPEERKCGEEHRQLAEWLKDYKRLLKQEPCEDCISRELVKAEYRRRFKENLIDESRGIDWSEYVNCDPFNEFIDSIPPVTPQPKTGHWEQTRYRSIDQTGESYDDGTGFRCSNCANVFKVTSLARYHYCPHCGAKMVEPQESEE